ncbi:hypothetical protein [Methyloglobulus sp.]|uniref:hypothetical protein n=1 Tax=Methyloglobulus sp. TaxID=2518622 RepID=UPI0032B8066A
MKTKYTVLVSAILMGTAFTVSAGPPAPPSPYGSGPLGRSSSPNMFTSEKAAFAALEGVLQEAEAVIYQGGCAAAAAKSPWNLSVLVDLDGSGGVDVSSGGNPQFHLDVAQGMPVLQPPGTVYNVTGLGTNVFAGSSLPVYSTIARYNRTGQMMVQSGNFDVKNVNGNFDKLTGGVIKDFYRTDPMVRSSCIYGCSSVPVIYDWGLQFVSKNTIPQDKWWQRSAATRSDGNIGKTHFVKDRLFSDKSTAACQIEIWTKGFNDADGFDQTGTLYIRNVKPQPF